MALVVRCSLFVARTNHEPRITNTTLPPPYPQACTWGQFQFVIVESDTDWFAVIDLAATPKDKHQSKKSNHFFHITSPFVSIIGKIR